MKLERTRDIATCHALRRTVFIEEQGVSEADDLDGLDDVAIHLLVSLESKPVGTARLLTKKGTLKVGRVCILPEARGRGLGVALIQKSIEIARAEGVPRVYLGAQTSAVGFYERLGFEAFGTEFDDAGIPHRHMELFV